MWLLFVTENGVERVSTSDKHLYVKGIVAWWSNMVSSTLVNFGSGNGLLLVRYQAITWTRAVLFLSYYNEPLYSNWLSFMFI